MTNQNEINAKKGRNNAIMLAIICLIAIIFVVTIIKMSGGVK